MDKKINRVEGCHENDDKFLDNDTLVLVNTSSHEESVKFTDLSVNGRKFSEISDSPDSVLKVNHQGKLIVNLEDKNGRKFPGVRINELHITDDLINLKIESGDLISLVRLTSEDNLFPDELVNRIIDLCNPKELFWDKF